VEAPWTSECWRHGEGVFDAALRTAVTDGHRPAGTSTGPSQGGALLDAGGLIADLHNSGDALVRDDTSPAGLVILTPPRFPQPAPSGCRWSGEGSAGGRSRRDVKRPSGDRGSRHADRVGCGPPTSPVGPTNEQGRRSEASSRDSRSPPRLHRRPAASPHPVPKTLSGSRPPPVLANGKVQVSRNVHEESRVANHAGGVRDVLRHLMRIRPVTCPNRSPAFSCSPAAPGTDDAGSAATSSWRSGSGCRRCRRRRR
jgi:hypothetical protein